MSSRSSCSLLHTSYRTASNALRPAALSAIGRAASGASAVGEAASAAAAEQLLLRLALAVPPPVLPAVSSSDRPARCTSRSISSISRGERRADCRRNMQQSLCALCLSSSRGRNRELFTCNEHGVEQVGALSRIS